MLDQNTSFQCPLCMDTKPCAIKVQHLTLCLADFQYAFGSPSVAPSIELATKKHGLIPEEDSPLPKKRRADVAEAVIEDDNESVVVNTTK